MTHLKAKKNIKTLNLRLKINSKPLMFNLFIFLVKIIELTLLILNMLILNPKKMILKIKDHKVLMPRLKKDYNNNL